MPANWDNPQLSSLYTDFLLMVKERDLDSLTLCNNDPTNIPQNAMKYDRTGNKFQERISGAWQDKVLSVAGGGTGVTNLGSVGTAMGLGSMAYQNSNAVSITGGTIGGSTAIDASRLTSGLVAPARLAPGPTGLGQNVLLDNQTWGPLASTIPVGAIFMWGTNVAPAGYLMCYGNAVSRATYAALFAVLGGTYGAGDGSTTFNLPTFVGRFPKGVEPGAADIGTIGGVNTHAHLVPSAGLVVAADGQHYHLAGSLAVAAHGHGHNLTVQNHSHLIDYTIPTHQHWTGGMWTDGSVDNSNADAGSSFSAARGGHPHWWGGKWSDHDGSHRIFAWSQGADVHGVDGGIGNAGAMAVVNNTDWGTPITHAHGMSGTATSDYRDHRPQFTVVNMIIKY